ncbi:endolytic transglycosylase MltG [Agromyces sp. MMS24-K17]|uniref:endolytic transglycosylase MltG n=1 Tax=Agromyces sp. MMS24-K17 TaxID=3372850 RepID=UPI0037544B6E
MSQAYPAASVAAAPPASSAAAQPSGHSTAGPPVAVETGPVPLAADGRPLTRREIRELERQQEAALDGDAPDAADARFEASRQVEPPQPQVAPAPYAAPSAPHAAPAPYAAPGRADAPPTPFSALLAEPEPEPARSGGPAAAERPAAPDLSELLGVTEPISEGRPSRAERRLAASTIDQHHDGGDEKPKRRGGWGCVVGLVVLVALAAGAFFFLQGPVNALLARFEPAADFEGSGTGEVTFMIHEGDTGSDIATNLVDEGVTASYDAFYDVLLAESPEPEFHPGAYRLAEEMSARSALDALLDPANKLENTFVIPEGTALPDALALIAEGSGIPLDQLQAAAAEPPANYGLPAEATSLEGFLAPRTYTLDPNQDAHAVLQTLVDRQFQALDEAGVPADQRWRTIVLASVVQREAGSNTDDFPKIARVFQNRLDQGINLESDATVAYGTGNTDTVWTTDEERADASNPYNTYANPGLPAGPIGNPGDVAINAAIHPADGTWLFFVPVNLETGETVFSTTVEEHDAAVARLHEWCEANADTGYCD